MIDIGRVEKLESCLPDNLQAIDLMAKNIVGGTLSACSIELGGAKMGFLSFASQGEWNTDGLLITVACLTPEFLLAGGKSIDNRELILRLQQLPIFGSEEARESARKAAKLDPDEILKHEHLLRLLDPSPYVLSQEEILETALKVNSNKNSVLGGKIREFIFQTIMGQNGKIVATFPEIFKAIDIRKSLTMTTEGLTLKQIVGYDTPNFQVLSFCQKAIDGYHTPGV